MTAQILNGKEVAEKLLESLKPRVKAAWPKLCIVQVGNNPASDSYIKQKLKSCDAVGMMHEHLHFPESVSFQELLTIIHNLNDNKTVSGFIIQLPLPEPLAQEAPQLLRAVDPAKDVDGFGAYNLGKMFLSSDYENLPPATPAGIITLLEYYKIPVEGKHAVIVGRSNIVGKPLAVMLLNRGATVTVCHSKTQDLASFTRQADILVSAVGKPKLITKDMVKPGAVVIDVGTNRLEDKLVGDVDFEAVQEVASAITPVPGGVGPLTVASLIRNCVRARERQKAKAS